MATTRTKIELQCPDHELVNGFAAIYRVLSKMPQFRPGMKMAIDRTKIMVKELAIDTLEKHEIGPKGVFRFRRGQYVWVRDRGHGKRGGGFSIVQARVRERHYHPGRHPFYPNGEGYALDGELWWDCYPGCRVFATREQAVKARIGDVHG